MILDPEVGVGLQAKPMNRHTFWRGQSGSGKTYALGVALEQILLHTRLPIVIFDSNSDFVRLDQISPDAPEAAQALLAERDIRILRPRDGPDSLRLRCRDLSSRARASTLQLDPVIDRQEYNIVASSQQPDGRRARKRSSRNSRRQARRPQLLAERLENLEIFRWRTWAYDSARGHRVIDSRPVGDRCWTWRARPGR